jgi:hypothetical protein
VKGQGKEVKPATHTAGKSREHEEVPKMPKVGGARRQHTEDRIENKKARIK